MSRLPFLQFICPEDHQRFTDFAEVSHTTDAPSSLHVRMQRSDSSHFEAQIFLVTLLLSGHGVVMPRKTSMTMETRIT